MKKARKTFGHTKQFWDKKYQQYKVQLKINAKRAKVKTRPMTKTDFKKTWNDASSELKRSKKSIAKYIANAEIFSVDARTARTALSALREAGYDDYTLDEVKAMETHEIAELLNDDIKAFYHKRRADGLSAAQARKEVAANYFGSPV